MTFPTNKTLSSSVSVDVDDLIEKLEEASATSVTDTSSISDGGDAIDVDSYRLTRVAFTSVQIRHFDRVAGDHPDVRKGGPPLSLGWNYAQDEAMDLDDYELAKATRETSDKPQWMMFGMKRLTSARRSDILRTFEVPLADIAKAEAEAAKVRKQRQRTNMQLGVFGFSLAEEVVQSATRKMKKISGKTTKPTVTGFAPKVQRTSVAVSA